MNFRDFLTESTTASIIVKVGDKYSMSYLRADGSTVGNNLKKYFNGKKALDLVSKSGEIRTIRNNKIEFYNDKILLKKNLSEKQVIKEANDFGDYIYYYDGKDWYSADDDIYSLSDLRKF